MEPIPLILDPEDRAYAAVPLLQGDDQAEGVPRYSLQVPGAARGPADQRGPECIRSLVGGSLDP
jgi:hypothetical protein